MSSQKLTSHNVTIHSGALYSNTLCLVRPRPCGAETCHPGRPCRRKKLDVDIPSI
jgi:hypothetical protein